MDGQVEQTFKQIRQKNLIIIAAQEGTLKVTRID